MPLEGSNRERMTRPTPLQEALVPARSLRRLLVVAGLVAALVGTGLGVAPTADAASRWAAAATAPIHPGVQTYSETGQCTANYVFFRGDDVFIGQAAHCTSLGGQSDTDGCTTQSRPLGTQVEVVGATRPGVLVYSSWLAMQAAGEKDPNVCAGNDFALIRLDPADRRRVNPTIPHWGGPTGINKTGLAPLNPVYSYGDSSLRHVIGLLRPKSGVSLGDSNAGWSHDVFTITPGIPGDSGSAMLDGNGLATGVLSTIYITPVPGMNAFADFNKVFQYARAHGQAGLLLALGTTRFNPNQLPLG